jgi:hypothetical protein
MEGDGGSHLEHEDNDNRDGSLQGPLGAGVGEEPGQLRAAKNPSPSLLSSFTLVRGREIVRTSPFGDPPKFGNHSEPGR